MLGYLFLTIIALSLVAFYVGLSTGGSFVAADTGSTHSLPGYHGAYVAIWVGIPAVILVLLWLMFQDTVIDGLLLHGLPDGMTSRLSQADRALLLSEIHNVAGGQVFREPSPEIVDAALRYERWSAIARVALFVAAVSLMLVGLFFARSHLSPSYRARNHVERALSVFMVACLVMAILTTVGIIVSLVYEAWEFLKIVPPADFFFGLKWEPQIVIRADQIAGSGAFGAVPIFVGTLVIATIAMVIAVPTGLFNAIYIFKNRLEPGAQHGQTDA